MSALLAAACALLVAAALWELAGERGEDAREGWRRRLSAGRLAPPAAASRSLLMASARRRIEAADLAGRVSPTALLAAKTASAALAIPAALAAAPVAPGRFGSLVLIGVPASAFLAPDLLLDRVARARRERVTAALPDALDLMATGAATGRGPGALLADAMANASGPLREDLARTVAAIECGTAQERALRDLRDRSRGEGLAALAGALERSRRHGAPLAHALHEQAGSLRVEQRRRIGEHAARAAPKMQLVVALLLVPSVLLVVAAAIVANSGSLLPSY